MVTTTQSTCLCGCKTKLRRGQWVPGHDARAVHQRIRRDHGSVAAFVAWYDMQRPIEKAARRAA